MQSCSSYLVLTSQKYNNTMRILLIIISTILFVSCKTQQLYLNVVEPAPVTLPDYIRSAGVINRSEFTGDAEGLDALDRVLTLEGKELDKDGAAASISALASELTGNSRFAEVKPLDFTDDQVKGPGIFPPPLNWTQVDEKCREGKVDAIFSLELFDTDTRISYQVRKTDSKRTLLGAIAGIEQQADMITQVKTGWRIYDPSSKSILHEITMNRSITFSATGLTPAIAAAALIDRKEAVKQVGSNAGKAFAWRLLPFEVRVSRDYFVKGNDNFRLAMRRARTGNWDLAGEIWLAETSNPQMKIAGRACYNMAIISEINGNLGDAILWAQKAYEDYRIRKALKYLRILEYRMNSERILREQGN